MGNVSFRHLFSMEIIPAFWVAFRVWISAWERVSRAAVGGVFRRTVLDSWLIVHVSVHWIFSIIDWGIYPSTALQPLTLKV